jgi:hypothetical protein
MYHLAQWPLSICGCTSTWIHVPAGVLAFHDATSWLTGKSVVTPEVQVP